MVVGGGGDGGRGGGVGEKTITLGSLLRTAVIIGIWYSISATTILTTKWLLSPSKGELFPFPLLLTTCSNTVATLWALLMSSHPRFRPPPVTVAHIRKYVLPIGAVTALDLGCANAALKILDVSFDTIIKGAAPVFTMLWGFSFGIEPFSLSTFASLVTISSGVALASLGEGRNFMLLGFLLQIFATALAGLRWSLTQLLLSGEQPLPPVTVILFTSPATAMFLAPVAVLREGPNAMEHVAQLSDNDRLLLAGLLFGIGSLVFILLCSEYWLVEITSSLALSVCAVFKELLTIGGGLIFFGETLTKLNAAGFVICQIGIGAYVVLRSRRPETSGYIGVQDEENGLSFSAMDDPWDDHLSPLPVQNVYTSGRDDSFVGSER